MLKGINLTLMIGPAVPVPVPKAVIEALESVQVNGQGTKTGFQLTFNVSKKSPLLNVMLPAGYFDPMVTRVIIVVTLKGQPNVLMDGLVTRQELAPSSEPGQSKLTITGEDLSVAMDVVEIKRPYPGMPEVAQIYSVLAPYAALGIVPIVIPPFIIETPASGDGWGTQTGTDLQYVQQIASRSGYVFLLNQDQYWDRVLATLVLTFGFPIHNLH